MKKLFVSRRESPLLTTLVVDEAGLWGLAGLALFGGGRKQKIQGLQARAAILTRWIATCEQALDVCSGEAEEVQGYRTAQRVRGSLLQSELDGHRLELESVVAQIEALEAQAAGGGSAVTKRAPMRRRLVAGAVAGLLLLLAVALPVEHGLGLIPTLIATEEVIEVDPRALGSIMYPTLAPSPAR